jgi:hypothetical protein
MRAFGDRTASTPMAAPMPTWIRTSGPIALLLLIAVAGPAAGSAGAVDGDALLACFNSAPPAVATFATFLKGTPPG